MIEDIIRKTKVKDVNAWSKHATRQLGSIIDENTPKITMHDKWLSRSILKMYQKEDPLYHQMASYFLNQYVSVKRKINKVNGYETH